MDAMPQWTQRWAARVGVGVAAVVVAGAGVALIGGDTTTDRTVAGTAVEAHDGAAGAARAGDESAQLDGLAATGTAGGGADVSADMAAAPTPVAPAGADAVVPSGAKVIKTASLGMEVEDGSIGTVVAAVSRIAGQAGGFVEATARSSADEEEARADLTLRVPVDRFDAVLDSLRGLGTVESEELAGDEVTDQIVDFDARIRSLQAQEEALRALLSKAQGVGQILEVQNHVFNVRTQIEQLQAQRDQLDRQASLATVHVSLFEPGAAALAERESAPKEGLARSAELAVDGAVAVVGGSIVVLGYAVPLGVIALLVWLVVSSIRRRTTSPVSPT